MSSTSLLADQVREVAQRRAERDALAAEIKDARAAFEATLGDKLALLKRERYEASNTALCMRCGAVMEHTVPSFVTCTIGGHDAIIEGVAQFVPERRVQLSGVPVYSCPACGLVETEAMRRAKLGDRTIRSAPSTVAQEDRTCAECEAPFQAAKHSRRKYCSERCQKARRLYGRSTIQTFFTVGRGAA